MKPSELTTAQAVMVLIGIMIFMLALCLGVAWSLLWAWNLLASSIGWTLIPVNWLTVIATMILSGFVRSIFKRDK